MAGVSYTPRPLSYTGLYASLPLPGALCCVSISFGVFSTSRCRWCVVVTARCCGRVSAVVAVSLTRRGGGDWGGKVREGGGRGGGDGRVLTLDGSRYLMCELSRDPTQWAKQNA